MLKTFFNPKKKRSDECYYDVDDSIVRYDHDTVHNGYLEFEFVSAQEGRIISAGDVMYLIDTQWLDLWLSYCNPPANEELPPPGHPGRITNTRLMDKFGKLINTMKLKDDFRPVNMYVWQYLFTKYGGGPVVLFYVPSGYSEKQYKSGSWIKKIVDSIPEIIITVVPSTNPTKIPYVNLTDLVVDRNKHLLELELKKLEQKKKDDEFAALQLLEQQKLALEHEAAGIQTEINAENAEIALQTMFVGAQADTMLHEARGIDRQIESETMTNVANIFQMNQEYNKINDLKKVAHLSPELMMKLRTACATVIQIKYRRRLASRKLADMRNKSRELKLTGYARKVQCLWRTRLARKRVLKMKEERRELLQLKSTILIQCLFRRRKARKFMKSLRDLKALKRIQDAKEAKAKLVLASYILYFIAKCRFRRKYLSSMMHTVMVNVKSATNLMAANLVGNTSDPYVVVVGARITPVFTNNQVPNPLARLGRTEKEMRLHLKKTGVQRSVCMAKTHPVDATLNPTWNQSVLVSGVYGSDYIILNVYDKDTIMKDKFLGQVEICLADYPALFHDVRGREIHIHNMELGNSNSKIYDEKGNVIPINDVLPAGKLGFFYTRGTISFSLSLPTLARSCCGWINKYSSSAIPGMPRVYKRRWLLLMDERLEYFDDPFNLDNPRYQIACKDVSIIEQVKDDKGRLETIIIAFGKDNWQLKFLEEEEEYVRQRWLRKISNSCVNLGFRSRATVSTLANFPILHTVRQLVNDEKNRVVANLPFAPEDPNAANNTATTTPARRPSLLKDILRVNSMDSGAAAASANSTPNAGTPGNPPVLTKRRTSMLGGALDSVNTLFHK